ncbi:MAG: hypothetical protein ACR2P9_01115, partial [Gammaproteobacteria bacterium]
MTAKPILTAQDFTEHFVQCWDDFVTDEILEDYPKSEPWTLRMLGTKHACSRKGAFLEKLCKKLNYRCNWEEPFRVDVSYVRKEGGFLLGDNEHYTPADYQYYYPTEYNVLIEHENGDNIHQE